MINHLIHTIMPKINCQEVVNHVEPKVAQLDHGSKAVVLKLDVAEIKELVNKVVDEEDGGQIWAIIGEHNSSDTAVIMGVNNGLYVPVDQTGGVALQRWSTRLTLDELNHNYSGHSHHDKLKDFFEKEAGIVDGTKDTTIKK